MKTMLKDIMNPLVEFHKVGIHLNFKPKNLIVFERMEEEKEQDEEVNRKNKAKEEKEKEEKEKEEKEKEEKEKEEKEKEEKEKEEKEKGQKVIKLVYFGEPVLYLYGQKKGIVKENYSLAACYTAPELLQVND
ncbi:hypothetical protein niasHT_029966 [Heterodera trifolii]|uniref:Uncharacterized protein n=1 Tax=Heterodera trifolii TaxID=157864 RepID=A0ABD2JVV6_9BILA